MGKKLIPRCVYCKKKLGFTHQKYLRDMDPESFPPTRGRCGLNRWCSLACLEEHTKQQWTGRSQPRGASHSWKNTKGGE